MTGAPPLRRTVLTYLLTGLVLVAATVAIWVIVSDGSRAAEAATVLGFFATVIGLAAQIAAGSRPALPPQNPTDLADDLARIVEADWLAEARARQLRNPGVLPLSWSPEPPAGGSRAVVAADPSAPRLKGGTLADGFDTAAGRLAQEYLTLREVIRGRVVILGEPGAGKTVLAMMLTVGLLKARASGTATPVLLSASSWEPSDQTLDEWIVETVTTTYYGGRPEIPRQLLEHDLLIPVIDGLDEIRESARRLAVERINEAVGRERSVVVTCRSAEYTDMVQEGAPALRRAPVVYVARLSVRDVITYLDDVAWSTPEAWEAVRDRLENEPDGELAAALSTPLMVSVARTVYQRGDRDPAELLSLDSRHQVEDHLIDRLVYAATSPDETIGRNRSPWASRARDALTYLARYLGRHREPDLLWWQLGQRTLSAWVAPAVGLLGGGLLLLFVTMATATVLGIAASEERPVTIGAGSDLAELPPAVDRYPIVDTSVQLGAVAGTSFMLLAIITWYATPGTAPGRVSLALRGSLRRLRRGFVTGLALVAIPAVPLLLGAVVAASLAEGATAFTAIARLAELLGAALGLMMVIGLALAVHNWLHAPPEKARPADPVGFLRADRRSSLVGAAASGAVVAIGLAPALLTGVVVVAGVGHSLMDGPGLSPEFQHGSYLQTYLERFAGGSVPLLVIQSILPGVVFGLLMLLTRAWTRFQIARVVLALQGHLPWRLIGFLTDARERQLLRQAGGAYQFRHVLLQQRLARRPSRPPGAPDPGRRRVLIGAAGLLSATALAAVAIPRLPRDSSIFTLKGHQHAVWLVTFDPSQRRLATVSLGAAAEEATATSPSIRLWDVDTGRAGAVFAGGPPFAFAPDGQHLVLTSNGSVALWDTTTGDRVKSIVTHSDINDVAFSPNGERIAISRPESSWLWNSTRGHHVYPPDAAFLRFSPDDETLLVGARDRYLQWIDVETGDVEEVYTRHPGRLTAITFAPAENLVATLGGGLVQLRDLAVRDQLLHTLPSPPPDGRTAGQKIREFQFHPNGRFLAAIVMDTPSRNAQAGETVKLWGTVTGEIIADDVLTVPARIESIAFSETGHYLLVRASGVPPVLVNTTTLIETVRVHGPSSTDHSRWSSLLEGHDGPVTASAFNPRRPLVATASRDGTARLWDSDTGRTVATFAGHTDAINSVAFSPDGRVLATGSDDRTARLWEIPSAGHL